MIPPRFLYFDLGKVLVNFDVDYMLRQVGKAARVSADRVRSALFGNGLMCRYETGRITTADFCRTFCAEVGCRVDDAVLVSAAADIFTLNLPVLPLVAQLCQAGYPLGILSNTSELHWEHCARRFRIVADGFAVHALSYRIQAVKPDVAIFRAAAELAGRRPEEIFFVDDLAGHVEGPRRRVRRRAIHLGRGARL